MKKLLGIGMLIALVLVACRREEPHVIYTRATRSIGSINDITWGNTGVVSNVDLSGKGSQTNLAGTTVVIKGTVTVDALTGNGTVIVPKGSKLIINNNFQMSGGSTLLVEGTVEAATFSQIGDVYLNGARVYVDGKYQVSGGTTTYMQNSLVTAGELVIIGDVKAVDNDFTQSTNVYSVFHLTEEKYLNRAGGTNVCGPVLFTHNFDHGATNKELGEVSETVLENNPNIDMDYALPNDLEYYQYNDDCAALTRFPAI